jgi:cobalt-zinc-cadmium efflux system outer membrane protein
MQTSVLFHFREISAAGRYRTRNTWIALLALACCSASAVTVAAAAESPTPVALSPASLSPIPVTLLERLTLQQAETIFAERNRELLIARRMAEGAEADVLSAAAPPNPELSLGTARINPRTGIGPGKLTDKYVDTVIGMSQVFERGNKRGLRTEAAQFNATAARNDENDVVRQQRLLLQAAYFDLKLAQERFRISNSTADLFDKSVAAAEHRLRAGDIAATELSRIQVDALRARNDARNAQAERERSQLALAYLIGTERNAAQIIATDPWPNGAGQPPAAISDDVLERRADIRAAQDRVNAAEKNRDLARALRTRDITAGLQYEHFPGDAANNSYGFTISIPIFARYQYAGEIRRAEVELQAAQENLDRLRAVALGELRRADSALTASDERVRRLADVLLPAAEKAANGAEFANTRGAIGLMDLLDARRQFYAAQLETISARADYAKALAAKRSAIAFNPN